jgi:hypothetical protein
MPIAIDQAQGSTGPTTTDNTVNMVQAGAHALEVRKEQTNSDVNFLPVNDANSVNGWQIPNDNADNDGIEITLGVLADATASHVFTVGTDTAFFLEVQMGIPDVSEYDVCSVGFRTATGDYTDAINAAATLYGAYSAATEHAFGINVDAGDYTAFKTTNGTDAQDDLTTTDAVDDDTPTIRIMVSSAGAVSASIDATAVTLTNAGTAFDTADVVIPYLVFCKAAGNTDTPPILHHLAWGLQ